jgi:predicted histidine transporter YuiF (NhaC family)
VAGLIDIHDIGQIGTIFGIFAVIIMTFFQIRSYKKDQHEQQERNRERITKEITDSTDHVITIMEARLEALKIASLISKDDLEELRNQFIELKAYVNEMDREGTVEWQKVKPFITRKMEEMEQRINDLYKRMDRQ